MVILNLTRQSIPAKNACYAADFRTRLFGLIGKSFSVSMDGMVFARCNGIHTFFMKYPIDVIFADGKYRVLKTAPAFPAWRPWLVCRNAYYVIELPAGTIESTGTEPGDQLDLTGALSNETLKHWLGKKLLKVKERETCSSSVDADSP